MKCSVRSTISLAPAAANVSWRSCSFGLHLLLDSGCSESVHLCEKNISCTEFFRLLARENIQIALYNVT